MARTRRRKLLLGVVVTLGLLLLLEGAARLAYRGRWPHFFVHDPELGWAHRPGWSGQVRAGVEATFDARGLREERDLGPKRAPRVLVLGDSVAFGYGLPQDATISRALERAAGAEGRALQAINAGVPGYATEQEVRLLERVAPDLRPDVVALLLCLRNDLGVPPLDPSAARDLAPRDAVARALLDRSALAFAIARLAHRRAVRASRDDADGGPQEEPSEAPRRGRGGDGSSGENQPRPRRGSERGSSPADHTEGGEPPFLPPDAVAALPEAERAHVFAVARERLRAFRDAARARGARPVLVLCPEVLLVTGAAPREAVVDPLLAIAAELDLPALDLLPVLRGAPDLLREKDGVHPTKAGAERIAGALLAFLVARGAL